MMLLPILSGLALGLSTPTIDLRTCDSLAQAICSVRWKGKEFISAADHGRELQSASSFDWMGEGFNPTEAGSVKDGEGWKSSSSVALWSNAGYRRLDTETNMAFWQSGKVSGHRLTKRVTMAAEGIWNAIKYEAAFEIPTEETHSFGTFEITGYMPPEFGTFWTYEGGKLEKLEDGPGEQGKPVILATAKGDYAMGVYAEGIPQAKWPGAGYGRWRFGDCVKWNNVMRVEMPKGTVRMVVWVFVGSLADVEEGMDRVQGRGK